MPELRGDCLGALGLGHQLQRLKGWPNLWLAPDKTALRER
jgi:hypothetical protein